MGARRGLHVRVKDVELCKFGRLARRGVQRPYEVRHDAVDAEIVYAAGDAGVDVCPGRGQLEGRVVCSDVLLEVVCLGCVAM